MTDQIPPEPSITGTENGVTTWEYRGAVVRSFGVPSQLLMPGHPLHNYTQDNVDSWWPLIDRWLDHGDLPPPYVWRIPPR